MRRVTNLMATIGLFGSIGAGVLTERGPGGNAGGADDFQPIKEADMPEGFPAATAVGQVEVKRYPAYRRATASGLADFWTLFRHIQQNDVAMTAPVEMDFGEVDAARAGKRAMSFLYERPDQGTAGKQGRVEVVDVEPATVVSIGCRGPQNSTTVAEARGRLLQWLDENEQYVPVGSLRVMGYNSPFVPREKNFFEVQIPIEQGETPATDR